MSRNSRIACISVVIVFLCTATFCVLLSLVGVLGYIYTSPPFLSNLPFPLGEATSPTPSPVVIRPTLQATSVTPTIPMQPVITPISSPAATSELTPPVAQVPTDTLHTLENTLIPINDPLELAHRLLGLDTMLPTVAPPGSPYETGAQEQFWIGNDDEEKFRIQATLQYITAHAYFWIEDGVKFSQHDLANLAESFENQIYPTTRAFFGSEWTPGVDGDPHIYILYAGGVGEGIAGYFSSADEYPATINPFSNAHEMFVFNADNSPLDEIFTYGVLAHELQHMIHWYQDRNESNWLSEGFSELAALLNNYYDGGFDGIYTAAPDIQLNNWPDDSQEDTTPHYGASFLFVAYFLDRFGEMATKALVANQDNDLDSLDSTLSQINAIDPLTGQPIRLDEFFIDWAITNYLMDEDVGDGRYSYARYRGTLPAEPIQSYPHCPIDPVTTDVHQFGVDYIRFTCRGSYSLHFEGSIQAPLLPADPHSGHYAFWANKSDESDTILTRSFDLTRTSGPISLSYWTWYDIENGWDYAYLEASLDGENWQILTTPSGTQTNPKGNNYGWGYTGASGEGSNSAWIQETVDLSQFAGHRLTLRFEYLTDSNVTGEGFLLDDLSIPEIGYFADFETDGGGWQPQGWARIQNILPQDYRLALISIGDDTQVRYLKLDVDTTSSASFTIGAGVDEVVLVVSGTTRFTRQMAPYRYSVTSP